MFIGHFAVGFGGKAAARGTSLGTFFVAAQLIDLIWPTLLLIGLETVAIRPGITRVTPLDFLEYPITHSFLAVIGWAVLFGTVYFFARRYRVGALAVGAAVLSHWLLDFLTHRPDLPLYPGGARVGLGLWNSLWGTLVVELTLFAIGVWLYARTTRATDRAGSLGFWALVAFLLLIYVGNVFGEPPPSVVALAWVGQAQWLLVAWGFWLDRHRVPS